MSNIIKCPRCNSANKKQLKEEFYLCNQCGNHYYYSVYGNMIQPNSVNHKNNLLVIILAGLVILGGGIYLVSRLFSQADHSDQLINYQQDEHTENSNINIENPDFEQDNVIAEAISAYPRTAFVLYQNENHNRSYLFRADFLTRNNNSDDQQAVLIKNEGNQLVGYDALSGKLIPNFNLIGDTQLSLDAAILYSDNEFLIIKNKVADDYQLEMFDAYNGEVIWTLSAKELVGIDSLTGKYSTVENKGIILSDNDFMIKLPPNYYLIDREGQIVDYGKID